MLCAQCSLCRSTSPCIVHIWSKKAHWYTLTYIQEHWNTHVDAVHALPSLTPIHALKHAYVHVFTIKIWKPWMFVSIMNFSPQTLGPKVFHLTDSPIVLLPCSAKPSLTTSWYFYLVEQSQFGVSCDHAPESGCGSGRMKLLDILVYASHGYCCVDLIRAPSACEGSMDVASTLLTVEQGHHDNSRPCTLMDATLFLVGFQSWVPSA